MLDGGDSSAMGIGRDSTGIPAAVLLGGGRPAATYIVRSVAMQLRRVLRLNRPRIGKRFFLEGQWSVPRGLGPSNLGLSS
jgi:hypothetical protein